MPDFSEADPFEDKKSGAERLKDFEDQHLSKDAVRINGRIERGFGSPYQKTWTHEMRHQHAALEKLIEAEDRLASAHATLLQATNDHAAALVAAEPKSDGASAE